MKKIAVAVAIHGQHALIRYIQFPDELREKMLLVEGPKNQPLTKMRSDSCPEVSCQIAQVPGDDKARDHKIHAHVSDNPRAIIASLGLLVRMANWRYQLTEEPGPTELALVPKGFFVIT